MHNLFVVLLAIQFWLILYVSNIINIFFWQLQQLFRANPRI